VAVQAVQPVVSYQSSMGVSGSRHTMFVVHVDESMRVNGGGGLEYDSSRLIVLFCFRFGNLAMSSLGIPGMYGWPAYVMCVWVTKE
jgi:hypothetical protein